MIEVNMDEEYKIALLAEVLEVDAIDIHADYSLDKFESWDSMAALTLIVMLEENYDRTDIDSELIKSLVTVGDVFKIMERQYD
jgi:acyl carrier protein